VSRLRARLARSGADQAFQFHVAVAQEALQAALSVLGRVSQDERGKALVGALGILDDVGHLTPSYDTDSDLVEVRGRLRDLLENPEVLGKDETKPREHLTQALLHLEQARVTGIDVQVDLARRALQRALENQGRRVEARRARGALQGFRRAVQLVEAVLGADGPPESVPETPRRTRPRPRLAAGGDRR